MFLTELKNFEKYLIPIPSLYLSKTRPHIVASKISTPYSYFSNPSTAHINL